MSGGVDSTTAACLLKEQGFAVTGVTMKIWDGDFFPREGKANACYGPHEDEKLASIERLTKELNIPWQVIDLRSEYRETVLQYFENEYFAGRTPNPCVRCNSLIKFTAMPQKAEQCGIHFDYFATGHYSQVMYSIHSGLYELWRGSHQDKDQSYFLSGLTQKHLQRLIFPLGCFSKTEVRNHAARMGLSVANKVESQDFIASKDYTELFTREATPGPIENTEGLLLGEHNGIIHYTIGQRRGLGIAAPHPLYVIAIDSRRNAVIVGQKNEVFQTKMDVSSINWISGKAPENAFEAAVQIRYQHKPAISLVHPLGSDKAEVLFSDKQAAIAPGQRAVFYQNQKVLGGGTIR